MKNKILSLLIVFTLLASCVCFSTVVSADSEKYGEEALAHLQNLDILSESLESDEIMTRREFANAIYHKSPALHSGKRAISPPLEIRL